MSAESVEKIETACENGRLVFVSPISAWEIGLLTRRGRLALSMAPEIWFNTFINNGNAALAKMGPEVLIQSSFLPGTPPNDPADRIILATARHNNMTIVTRDSIILKYAKAGNVQALKC